MTLAAKIESLPSGVGEGSLESLAVELKAVAAASVDLFIADLTRCRLTGISYTGPDQPLTGFLAQIDRVTRIDRHIYLAVDPMAAPALAAKLREVFLVKGIVVAAVGTRTARHVSGYSFVLLASKGRRPILRRDLADILIDRRSRRDTRGAGLSRAALDYFLAASVYPGETVCDVSASAQVTRLAASEAQLRFVPLPPSRRRRKTVKY